MKVNSTSNLINDTIKSMLENTQDFMFVKDRNLIYRGSSEAFAVDCARRTGVADVVGKSDYEVFEDPAFAEKYRNDDEELIHNGIPKIEYREAYPGKNGEERYCLTTKYLIRNDAGEPVGVFGQCHDITEQVSKEAAYRKALDEATHIAETDALTGLTNRGGCEKRMSRIIEEKRPGLCCLMDVNGFKHINDKYGHSAGDYVLGEIAKSMRRVFRERDIIARFGGDEFLMFLPTVTGVEKAQLCLERFVTDVERDKRSEIGGERIRVSIGAVIYDGTGDVGFDTLYEKCDSAMYRCKEHHDMPFQIVGIDKIEPICGKRTLGADDAETIFNRIFPLNAQDVLTTEELTKTMISLNNANRVTFFIRLKDYSYVVLKETMVADNNNVPFILKDAKEMLAHNLNKKVLEPYRDECRIFLDLDTLADRLSDVDSVKCEYQNIKHIWCVSSFSVVEREFGVATKVLFMVTELTQDRGKAQELLQLQKEAVSHLANSELIFISIIDKETGASRVIQAKNLINANRIFDFDTSMAHEKTRVLATEQENFSESVSLEKVKDELSKHKNYRVATFQRDPGSGRYRRAAYSFSISEEFPEYILAVTEDVTEAFVTDEVTGMKNYDGFKMDCMYVLQQMDLRQLVVINFNIVNFKAINTMYGYEAGNWLLKKVFKSLKESSVPFLSVCRENADNFFCLCNKDKCDYGELRDLCVLKVDNVNGVSESIELHCGIYPVTSCTETIEEICDKARIARRFAEKEVGVNAYVLKEEEQMRYLDEAAVISSIPEAIAREELVVYYQPIYDAQTREVVSAEALVRWNHPEKGLIAPGLFVPVIEQTGQMSEVDIYVGRRVKRFLLNRLKMGRKLVPVSVNVSRCDLLKDNYMRTVIEGSRNNSCVNDMMRIEITETGLINISSAGESFLSEMRSMGILTVIDDFGTGYSSLASIANRACDIIKLDMGFVREIGNDEKTEVLIVATIKTAHRLGIKVVGEGVETEAQYEFLRDASCDYIQGYYFSKPLPESEFEKMLAD